jgi:hypothetical protein
MFNPALVFNNKVVHCGPLVTIFLNEYFRYAHFYRNVLGIRANDVVHLLTVGEHLEIFFATLGIWHLGAVPAFGESSLSDEALIDQVVIFLFLRPSSH